jgi:hypothetical protein
MIISSYQRFIRLAFPLLRQFLYQARRTHFKFTAML